MAKTKGTDVAALREALHLRGADVEAAIVERMSPAARRLYEKALAFDWSPVDVQMEVYLAAAHHLFPDSPQPMAELGRMLANKAYGGIYKVFLRIPTIKYVMTRTAQLWSTYYDTGQATVENATDTGLDVVVRGFPDLPAPMREMACGHMSVLLEMTGAKGGRVTVDDRNPQEWHWQLRWG